MLTLTNITRAFDSSPSCAASTSTSPRARSSACSGRAAAAKPRCCASSPGWKRADSGDVLLDGQSILASAGAYARFRPDVSGFRPVPAPECAAKRRVWPAHERHRASEQQRRAREVLELVGLSGFERRDVAQLSGGERQRVALARSLAPNPRLLMLDEPLGSLDAALRERLVVDLRAIIKRVGLTALYVTHDQHEAFVDRRPDRPDERAGSSSRSARRWRSIAARQTIFAARFLGLNNVVPVTVLHGSSAQTPLGTFDIPHRRRRQTNRAAPPSRRHFAGSAAERSAERSPKASFSAMPIVSNCKPPQNIAADIQAFRPRSSRAHPRRNLPYQHRAGICHSASCVNFA